MGDEIAFTLGQFKIPLLRSGLVEARDLLFIARTRNGAVRRRYTDGSAEPYTFIERNRNGGWRVDDVDFDHVVSTIPLHVLPDVMPDENVTGIADALFLTNNPAIKECMDAEYDNDSLAGKAVQLPDHGARANLLVTPLLGRSPDSSDVEAISAYLSNDVGKLSTRLRQTIWSMVTSAEFRFNH